ncbi:MAG: nuclear transport factor 2 family protein [Bacteroidetes bacterium]|nr:nuclear transport factor 2 family protein [Bacteroidota bacterium]
MKLKFYFVTYSIFFLLQTSFIFPSSSQTSNKKNGKNEKQQIIDLENKWLSDLHNVVSLDTILAPDFIHPVSQEIFLTKTQHINWAKSHPLPAGITQKFDTLQVRIYGNVGIANGIVETFDPNGKSIRKSIFTDVFVKRYGKWQAVNAQENVVQ